MSFAQQDIQEIMQDGLTHSRSSSIPDSHQLKASSVPNQCDNQKMPP